MAARRRQTLLAAIDVGTNAVRLKVARALPGGSLETLHEERDPVRPGEGLYRTGAMPAEVADRLMATLARFADTSRRYGAHVRAVATAAVREAKNRRDIVARARDEAGVELEVISGQEEARLICHGVLRGRPADAPALIVDIGGGSTEVVSALGEQPQQLWSVPVGAVRLSEIFASRGRVQEHTLGLMREFAAEAMRDMLPQRIDDAPSSALGSSGTIGALVQFAAPKGSSHATLGQLERAVEKLASMSTAERRRAFDPRRAEVIVAGAVVLEQVMRRLGLRSVTAVSQGLRDGVLMDLLGRVVGAPVDHSLPDAALAMGRRLRFDEPHGTHVRTLALTLFDALGPLHERPRFDRDLLEVAALLHDVGYAVSHHKHHKHTHYLLLNTDLPGLTLREREVLALVARFHRRTAPTRDHAALEHLTGEEFQTVRRLSTLLRVADALDRSHRQPVRSVRVKTTAEAVVLRLETRAAVDLELWDLENETALFRRVFGRRLEWSVAR